LKKGEKGTFVGVKDSSSTFLKFLDKRKISLGSIIEVFHIEDFDDSLHVSIGNTNLTISIKSANNIYLKKQ
jgi:DtxR family Mn-dependent transcriptional regulator